jgi:prolyl-tRNA synthetase
MKDAYSFDADKEGVDISYKKMFDAYMRIFERCGLRFRAVEADTGSIGGSFSHEFMVIADTGEDSLVFCSTCDYAANLEKAEIAIPEGRKVSEEEFVPLETVHTPDMKSIEEVSWFLSVQPRDVVKTMIYSADGIPVAVLVRGDADVNEIKVKNYLNCDVLEMADDTMIYKATGAPRGFAGAIGIKARIIADYSLMNMTNFVMGANKEDYHVKNVNIGRDISVDSFADLRIAGDTDLCPRCGGNLLFARGIEVGHVFKLGTKYSKAMKAVYLDKNGKEQYMVMGCYGIGIGRTVAASIEQNHDEHGIIWPLTIAPYQVIITPVNVNDEKIKIISEKLYASLLEKGVDVIVDDRDERAGVKFNDADLIGIPLRVTIGKKALSEQKMEVKIRKSGKVKILATDKVVDFILSYVNEGM